MIQRIQTVFLMVGTALMAGNFLLDDVWIGPASLQSSWFTPVTLGLYSLALIGGVFSVFQYKTLERQKKAITVVSAMAVFGLFSVCLGLILAGSFPLLSGGQTAVQSWLAITFPLTGVGCFELARRAVNRDVKLLRSVDRLR